MQIWHRVKRNSKAKKDYTIDKVILIGSVTTAPLILFQVISKFDNLSTNYSTKNSVRS